MKHKRAVDSLQTGNFNSAIVALNTITYPEPEFSEHPLPSALSESITFSENSHVVECFH